MFLLQDSILMHHIYVLDNYSTKHINYAPCFLRQITGNIQSLIKGQTDHPTLPEGQGQQTRR